jgi:hypothetical protein
MLTLLRRFAVIAALMFWQGGFVFYAAVVVPIGTQLLGGAKEQGFITRRVAEQINLAGAVCLLPMALDVATAADPCRWRRRLRWLSWLGMAAFLIALFWLHPQLDRLLSPDDETIHRVADRPTFRTLHRWYLWIISAQWGLAVVYMGLTLWAWRAGDRAAAKHRVGSGLGVRQTEEQSA